MSAKRNARADAHGYAEVNGLSMYYEIHGDGPPLLLLHGALSAIGTSFGKLLPGLARRRRVIAVEMQGHGRTADIDRPLRYELLADDIAAFMRQIGVAHADLFGWSLGAGVALQTAMLHPAIVRKLVLASVTYQSSGLYPELLAGIQEQKPEDMADTPFYKEYIKIAPHPEDFPRLFARQQRLDGELQNWPSEAIRAIRAPTLLIIGDADIVRPEHTIELFRLLGGGAPGDLTGMPRSQLAVLPGTTHLTLVQRAIWLIPMISEFLDAPAPSS
jgi:pimeloyl-ACP methyl ester carboxylesterase